MKTKRVIIKLGEDMFLIKQLVDLEVKSYLSNLKPEDYQHKTLELVLHIKDNNEDL